ncbi:MAG: NAD(+)/NADH kinase [Actinomycetota bacterium]
MRTVGLVQHPSNPKAQEVADRIRREGAQRGLEVVNALKPDGWAEPPNAVLALGGDGTLLRAAQIAWRLDVPVVGANLGNLGFLSTVPPDRVDEMVKHLITDIYRVEERMMLQAWASCAGVEVLRVMALNEVVVERELESRVISVRVRVGEETVADYIADGFIVATPTGSTAYSLSAGGPVVEPELQAMVLTAISPHSPLWRSIVINPDRTVVLEIPNDRTAVTSDGQLAGRLAPGSTVTVVRHPRPLKLLTAYKSHFYDKLRLRFHVEPPQG